MPCPASSGATGQSLPNAMRPPAAMMRATPRRARQRSGPMLSGHGPAGFGWFMSPSTTCIGCCEAITPSAPKRAMSASAIASMCSRR